MPRRRAPLDLRFLLLAAGWFAVAGCLSEPADDGDDGGGGGGGNKPGPDEPAATETAFFLLHPWHTRTPEWPTRFEGTDVFVANPSFPPADLAIVRAAFPEALLLASTSAQDMHVGLFSGNEYYQQLDAVFDSTLCVLNHATGSVVRIYGAQEGDPSSGVPTWVPREESIEALVGFHRDVTFARDWDGLYVDSCTEAYPPWRLAALQEIAPQFDFDGDGFADLPGRLVSEYAAWRPVLTRRLREELGDDVVIVANSGGALVDAALNGITLEGVGTRFEPSVALAVIAGAQAATTHPFLAVLWATTPESEAPSRELAATLAGVHFGELDEYE